MIQVLCLFPGAARVSRARFRPALPRRSVRTYLGRYPVDSDLIFLFAGPPPVQKKPTLVEAAAVVAGALVPNHPVSINVGGKLTEAGVGAGKAIALAGALRRIEDIAGRGHTLELVHGAKEAVQGGELCFAVATPPRSLSLRSTVSINVTTAAAVNTTAADTAPLVVGEEIDVVPGRWSFPGGGDGTGRPTLPECNFEVRSTDLAPVFPGGRAPSGYAIALDFCLADRHANTGEGSRDVCLASGGGSMSVSTGGFARIAATLSPYALYAPAAAASGGSSDNDSSRKEDDPDLFCMYELHSRNRRVVRVVRGPPPPPPPQLLPSAAAVSHPPNAAFTQAIKPAEIPMELSMAVGAPVQVVDVETGTAVWECSRSWLLVLLGPAHVLRLPGLAARPAMLRREAHRRCFRSGGFVHPATRPSGPSPLTSSRFPTGGDLEDDEEAHFADALGCAAARAELISLGLEAWPAAAPGGGGSGSGGGVMGEAITVIVEIEIDDSELYMDPGKEGLQMMGGNPSLSQERRRVWWTAAFGLGPEHTSHGAGSSWRGIVVSVDPPAGGGGGGGGVVVSAKPLASESTYLSRYALSHPNLTTACCPM
jgi:hypothetical protein